MRKYRSVDPMKEAGILDEYSGVSEAVLDNYSERAGIVMINYQSSNPALFGFSFIQAENNVHKCSIVILSFVEVVLP